MASRLCKGTIIPLEFDLFVGMDVDKRSIAITILDHYSFYKVLKMPYDPDAVVNYIYEKALSWKTHLLCL